MNYDEKIKNFYNEVNTDYNWVLKVISGCRTEQQFRTVRNLTNNFFNKWMDKVGRFESEKEKYVFTSYNLLILAETSTIKQLNIYDHGNEF